MSSTGHRFSRRGSALLGSLFLFLWLATVAGAAPIPPSGQKPVVERALQFVRLLDRQQPLKAWQLTTTYFRKKLPKLRWQRRYRNLRQPYGRALAREFAGYRYFSSFEQALDGLYLQVRFRTDFEARSQVIERVMMYKDFDGRWRVIGYFLEPG